MSSQAPLPTNAAPKPTLALMGEFSAGKSTLCNLLIGAAPLPTKVTATNLPPVWISYGSQPAERIDLNDLTEPLDMARLDEIDPATTQYLRISQRSKVLEMCDLIDMPGISDPNMPPEAWQRVIRHADAVIWCTHATQAWRQSEAAVWESFPQEIRERSILLITRFDKILAERDKQRVVQRVRHATAGQFGHVFPISLTQAIAARKDPSLWEASGAKAFADALIKTVGAIRTAPPTVRMDPEIAAARTPAALPHDGAPAALPPVEADSALEPDPGAMAPVGASGPRVVPRRIRAGGTLKPRPRPAPDTHAET